MRIQIFVLVCLVLAVPCQAKIITVNDDGPADFNNIQAAIDDSNDGDTIIVYPGLYVESINFLGKNITLKSTDPTKSHVVKSTTISGMVCFRGTEDPSCKLTGFNIDGYIAGFDWEIDPSGNNHTHATISHCVLENIITGCGRLIWACDGTISNCVIANTSYLCLRPWPVPAIVGCHGLIENCTMANMSDGIEVLPGATCTIENCIIYHSFPIMVDSGATLNISYCDLEGGLNWIFGSGTVNWGSGNIDVDPCFARIGNWTVDGDYHLNSQAGRWNPCSQSWIQDDVTSPCIDAGNPQGSIGQEPFPNGGRINMGAYGITAEASKSYFGKPVCKTIVAGDINGDCIVNFLDFTLMAFHWLENNTPINSSSQIKDGIEYYIETDKFIYHSGQNVEILYRVTNLTVNPVDLGWASIGPFAYHYSIVDSNDKHVWKWPWYLPLSPVVLFHLEPFESKQSEIIWDTINDNETPEPEDDFPAGPGKYTASGEVAVDPAENRVPVSVFIKVIP